MNHSLRPALAALVLALTSAASHGAIVYSGLQNIAVSNSFTSTVVDIDGLSQSSTQTPGWDVEMFFGGEAVGNSANFQPVRQTVAFDAPILRLDPGSVVDGGLIYYNLEAGSSTHVGTAPQQFTSGVEGYFGFRLIDDNSNGPYYGWVRVVFSNTGGSGTIVDWAYDNTGSPITVGAVPEPQAVALLGLGCGLVALKRRRKI
ncbi:MAG: hypothetical protein JWO82_340 [Akkermansiaceae bacterium]|nr:hypothetical protein [Akkermansiaceae bacterium]